MAKYGSDMMSISVYEELRTDLRMFITPSQARDVVDWLQEACLIDYDTLKEYYTDEEDEDTDE